MELLRKFSGFNMAVCKAFVESFDGVNAQVGDIELRLTEEFISQSIGLSSNKNGRQLQNHQRSQKLDRAPGERGNFRCLFVNKPY